MARDSVHKLRPAHGDHGDSYRHSGQHGGEHGLFDHRFPHVSRHYALRAVQVWNEAVLVGFQPVGPQYGHQLQHLVRTAGDCRLGRLARRAGAALLPRQSGACPVVAQISAAGKGNAPVVLCDFTYVFPAGCSVPVRHSLYVAGLAG
ncbi:hypothetical protein D1872_223460 [compost metagenome]